MIEQAKSSVVAHGACVVGGASASPPRSFIVRRRDGTEHTILYDEVDSRLVCLHRWNVFKSVNGQTFYVKCGATRETMHRILLDLEPGDPRVADHINGNGLDNRRSNLRVVNRSQNGLNTARHRDRLSSAYKGVQKMPGGRGWVVEISKDGVRHHLGCYRCEADAARAWNAVARILHGEHARLNVIPDEHGEVSS